VIAQQSRLRVAAALDRPFGDQAAAIEPIFGTRKTSRTSAMPKRTSLNVGSSNPAIAFFISSMTL